ncbi:MAG: PIG-L family deacetylase, partial [Rhodoferax sp.]|nr:PIG-L family deacetylase [Rhodoferax sp.]
KQTCVVAVTDGEASHPGSSRWPGHLLTRQRRVESLEGLELLGLPPGCRTTLGSPDGQVRAHLQNVIAWLSDFLRPDDVVISTWELDGHPDHEASAQAAANACARIGARHIQVPVWMWHWAAPGDARVPWRRMVRLRLSRDAADRKKLAIAAHRTQLEPQDSGRPPVLGSVVLARMLRPFEVFILPA